MSSRGAGATTIPMDANSTFERFAAGRASTTALLRLVADRLDALDEPAAGEAR